MNDFMIAVLAGLYIFIVFLFLSRILFKERDEFRKKLERIQNLGGAGEAVPEVESGRKKQLKRPKWFEVSNRLQGELDGAGLAMSAFEYMGVWLAAAIGLPEGAYLMTGNLFFMVLFLAAGVILPPMIVRVIRKRRMNQFSIQLGDSLMIVGNCLRSGFSVRQAVERIATDMPDPIAQEFSLAVSEMNYGADLEVVLAAMAVRMKNKDLELLTSAIRIQQRVGGNLSEIIDNVSEAIKDRIRIRRMLRTLTAQGRASGVILGCLPIVGLIGMTLLDPEYTGVLFTTSFGILALTIAGIMEGVGFLIIWKIVNIRIE